MIASEEVKAIVAATEWKEIKTWPGVSSPRRRSPTICLSRLRPRTAACAVVADYVTTEDGTGIVHTAPGHGEDDFHTGVKYGLKY